MPDVEDSQGEEWTLAIVAGLPFVFQFFLTDDETGDPIDLSGYTGEAQIRASYGSASAELDFDVSFAQTIEIPDGDDGTTTVAVVTLSATADQTKHLSDPGVWDVLLTGPDDDAEPERPLFGPVSVDRLVTR
jgi:hypothetical protein